MFVLCLGVVVVGGDVLYGIVGRCGDDEVEG